MSDMVSLVIMMTVVARLFYGSWPWEARKTWYFTSMEIRKLRGLQ